MTILKAIIMGLIQGLTEFLPISSSGHLAIFGTWMQLGNDGIFFEVLLHLATLVAVFAAFYREIGILILEGFSLLSRLLRAFMGKLRWNEVLDNEKKYMICYIILSMIPTVILALLFKSFIEKAYQGSLVPGIGLIITGIILWITIRLPQGEKAEKEMTLTDAVLIGIAQGIATLPGISRSGSTIVAGRVRGLQPELAVRFSFLMSIPAILGAGILELKDGAMEQLTGSEMGIYLIGAVVAGISGFLCIHWLLGIIQKGKLHYFAYYCFAMGTLATLLHFVLR